MPATEHGFKDASNSPLQILKWWGENPHFNIGIATEQSGLLVVDIDPRNLDGEGNALAGRVSSVVSASTGGGGGHFYFLNSKLGDGQPKQIVPGVDIKCQGGYVVAPPSVTTGPYVWTSEGTLEPPPEWLQTLLQPRQRPSRVIGTRSIDPLDDRPGSLYNQSATWEEILEPHGWTKTYIGTEGQQYWTRPGKDEGTSAVSGGEVDLFWCWSTSTSLESDASYTKFGLYAALNYEGDFTGAAQSLKDRFTGGGIRVNNWMGEPEPTTQDMASDTEDAPSPAFSGFLGQFRDYVGQQTDAYGGYADGAALGLLSVVAGSSYADLSTGRLNLNTYTMLVGPSTRSRKSTVQRIATDLLDYVMPDAVLADRMTGEGAIYNLAARSHQPSLWVPDEFGVTLAQIYTRDFMKPLEELFLTLYGKDKYVYNKADHAGHPVSVSIAGVHLSILGASTPESVALAGPNVSLGGLLPRFGVVFPGSLPPSRPLSGAPDLGDRRRHLVEQLRAMFVYCQAQGGRRVTFSPEALSVLAEMEQELEGIPTAVRLPVVCYKAAALLALCDLQERVDERHARDGVLLVREFAAGAARLDTYLHRKSSDLEMDRLIEAVTQKIKANGGTQYRQVISRELKLDEPTAKRVRATMNEWGLISVNTDTMETWSLL